MLFFLAYLSYLSASPLCLIPCHLSFPISFFFFFLLVGMSCTMGAVKTSLCHGNRCEKVKNEKRYREEGSLGVPMLEAGAALSHLKSR